MTQKIDTPVFYTLPAHRLTEGLSTDDGQDILSVSTQGDVVTAEVYTPRSDDSELDEDNRHTSETRIYRASEDVDLAIFADTRVDGRDLATQITCREYAVPFFRQEPMARDRLRQRVMRAIGDYETHQRLGYPMTTYKVTEYFQNRTEAWVSISGTSAVHSAMLAHFPWIPSADGEGSRP